MAFPPCPDHLNWKGLYRAAILETNSKAIPERISQAEQAIIARARQLFYCGGMREERNAVDHALHALHALKSSWKNSDAA